MSLISSLFSLQFQQVGFILNSHVQPQKTASMSCKLIIHSCFNYNRSKRLNVDQRSRFHHTSMLYDMKSNIENYVDEVHQCVGITNQLMF